MMRTRPVCSILCGLCVARTNCDKWSFEQIHIALVVHRYNRPETIHRINSCYQLTTWSWILFLSIVFFGCGSEHTNAVHGCDVVLECLSRAYKRVVASITLVTSCCCLTRDKLSNSLHTTCTAYMLPHPPDTSSTCTCSAVGNRWRNFITIAFSPSLMRTIVVHRCRLRRSIRSNCAQWRQSCHRRFFLKMSNIDFMSASGAAEQARVCEVRTRTYPYDGQAYVYLHYHPFHVQDHCVNTHFT